MPQIKDGMTRAGTMLIGFTPLKSKGFVNFFRIIINSPALTYQDMDFIVQEIDRLGRDL